jgi:hypothetical protein
MQEINFIQAFFFDYPANSNSTLLPTPATGLQNSRNNAIIFRPKA